MLPVLSVKTDSNNNQTLSMTYPCGSPLCPLCQFLKIRKEIAKTYRLFEKVETDKKLNKCLFYYLTLTMRDCHISQLNDAINELNHGFNRLRSSDEWKKMVVGSSKYMHFGINDLDRIQPHLHVIIMVIPSYTGNNTITQDEWGALWKNSLNEDYTPHAHAKSIGKKGKASSHDLKGVVAYGVNAVDSKDIEKYPQTYTKLMSKIHSMRKSSHQGLIYKLRAEVNSDYKKLNFNQVKIKSISIFKFNGEKYNQHRIINSDI